MAGIRERHKPGRLVEDSSVWKILYHLCSLFAICSFRDCLSIKARIEPGPCRRPEAPIHFRRWPRGAAEPHFPLKPLKPRPSMRRSPAAQALHIPVDGRLILFKCPRPGMNVQYWLPATSLRNQANADFCMPVVCLACTRLHFIHKGNWYVGDDRCQPAGRGAQRALWLRRRPPPLLSALLYFSPERNPLQCVIGSGGTRNE